MIATWLADKVWGIVIFCVACLSVILLPALVVQTVRINGITILGWSITDGYKPLYEKDEAALVTLRGNNAALSDGIKVCNASVDQLHAAGAKATADAQAAIADREKDAAAYLANIAALKKIKSTNEKCPVGDSILNGAFQ